jgi:hypothetical protein
MTAFPDNKVSQTLLRTIYPDVGSVLTAKLLNSNSAVIRRNTFQHLTREELFSNEKRKERYLYDESVAKRLIDPVIEQEVTTAYDIPAVTLKYNSYEDNATPDIDDIMAKAEHYPEGYDGYITAQVILPRGQNTSLIKLSKESKCR